MKEDEGESMLPPSLAFFFACKYSLLSLSLLYVDLIIDVCIFCLCRLILIDAHAVFDEKPSRLWGKLVLFIVCSKFFLKYVSAPTELLAI
jgi:hypothetical protein